MVMSKAGKKLSRDRTFDILNTIYLSISFLVVAYPLLYILSASFSNPRAVISGRVWLWPVDLDLLAYRSVFKNVQILSGYLNSGIYMALGTTISVTLTVLAAFPLSRREFYGRHLFTGIFVFTMLFSGGLIPTYLVVKNVGILNSRWAMVLPNALGIWNVIVTRTYFRTAISDDLYEAAQIEGCSDLRFLRSIVVPLSGPIIAVMALYYAVWIWNSYFDALIYLKSPRLYPLQIVLRNILILNQMDLSMIQDVEALARRQGLADVLKFALIVVASAPLLALYPFVQKYFVKGIMVGSLKG